MTNKDDVPAQGSATWRSISTAPKDGTPFDAWLTFKSGKSKSYRKPDVWWCERRGHWTWDGQWGGQLGPDIELTHWMPRPSDPTADHAEGAPTNSDAAWILLSRWENIARNGGEKWLREHPLVVETTKLLNAEAEASRSPAENDAGLRAALKQADETIAKLNAKVLDLDGQNLVLRAAAEDRLSQPESDK